LLADQDTLKENPAKLDEDVKRCTRLERHCSPSPYEAISLTIAIGFDGNNRRELSMVAYMCKVRSTPRTI